MVFEFGILSSKLIILLVYPISMVISKQLKNDFIYSNQKFSLSPLITSFMRSISYLIAAIPYLIMLCRSKNKKLSTAKKSKIITNKLGLIYVDIEKKNKIKKFTSLFLLSLLYMASVIIDSALLAILETLNIKNEHQKINNELGDSLGILSPILFYVVYSKTILNIKVYSHQCISLIVISFSLLILLIIDIVNIYETENLSILVISFLYSILLYGGIYSLYDVLVKKHFLIHFNVPYHLMFYTGLFILILTIPLDLTVFFLNNKKNFENFGLDIINQIQYLYGHLGVKNFFLWFIFDIIASFFWLAGIVFTLYYFSPCHFIICKTLTEFLSRFIKWLRNSNDDGCYKKGNWYFIVFCILYAIIIFSSIVYNELIIINLWSLEKNTIKYISFREKLDFENSLINDEEDSIIANDSLRYSLNNVYEEDDKET